jgi:O-acetyl-ADP-ribose deacetylase (regulator of RNase III)
MTQQERRVYLIQALLRENTHYSKTVIPNDVDGQKKILRSLLNLREPAPIDDEFLRVQDEYLQQELTEKGVTKLEDLTPLQPDLYVWRGDITTLAVDAIVNAANSGMTGCYRPCHACIDNCIHTFSGVQLRQVCGEMMRRQGHEEPTGQAKITPAFNLPSRYVLHTVGPIIYDKLTEKDCKLLSSCYSSCLKLAEQYGVESIAFCCISTGVFRFPQDKAAQIAIKTVQAYKQATASKIKVVFNVFKAEDEALYREYLTK